MFNDEVKNTNYKSKLALHNIKLNNSSLRKPQEGYEPIIGDATLKICFWRFLALSVALGTSCYC